MRRFGLGLVLVLTAMGGAVPAQATTTITVRGGWFTDAAASYCNPTATTMDPGFPPSYVVLHCITGQAVDGSFMGHSVATTITKVNSNTGATGTFDEWIYGMYWGDGSVGGLHVRGTFTISSVDGGFSSTGTIVGGTCDFAGSTGTLNSTGYGVTGGYSGSWILPAPLHGYTLRTDCVVPPTLP